MRMESAESKINWEKYFHLSKSLCLFSRTAWLFSDVYSREQTTRPPAPFRELPSPPQGLPHQELNAPFVCTIQLPHFRLADTSLIDLHLLLFHLKQAHHSPWWHGSSWASVCQRLLFFASVIILCFEGPFPHLLPFVYSASSFLLLIFLAATLPSEITKLPTDLPVRGFPTVWKLLLLDSLPRLGHCL